MTTTSATATINVPLAAGSPREMTKALKAEGYSVAEFAVRTWLAEGIVPCVRAGRNQIVTREALLNYIHGRSAADAR